MWSKIEGTLLLGKHLLSRVGLPPKEGFLEQSMHLLECLEKLSHPMTDQRRQHHMNQGEHAIFYACDRPLCV